MLVAYPVGDQVKPLHVQPRELRVRAPDGAEWRVARHGLTRARPRWRKRPVDPSVILSGIGGGGADSSAVAWLAAIAAILVVVFVVVPLLLFGIELVIAGCLIAAGLIGRMVFGRPWLIEARTEGAGAPRVLEWEVKGWRNSRRRVDEVIAAIEAGRDPAASVIGD